MTRATFQLLSSTDNHESLHPRPGTITRCRATRTHCSSGLKEVVQPQVHEHKVSWRRQITKLPSTDRRRRRGTAGGSNPNRPTRSAVSQDLAQVKLTLKRATHTYSAEENAICVFRRDSSYVPYIAATLSIRSISALPL